MTLIGRLAAFFLSRPNEWHDGRTLASIGGAYAWRTRVSELRRRAPYFMRIENRMRSVKRPDGGSYTVSEYRFVSPEVTTGEGVTEGALTPSVTV